MPFADIVVDKVLPNKAYAHLVSTLVGRTWRNSASSSSSCIAGPISADAPPKPRGSAACKAGFERRPVAA